MSRLFNSYYPVSIDSDAGTTKMANKIAEISNGKFSVYNVTTASRAIFLQYLNTNLILEITTSGSSETRAYTGSISSGSYVRISSFYTYVNIRHGFRISYSEIDDSVCCLTISPGESYHGSFNSTSVISFTIANTLINGNNYLTCCFDSRSNSVFGAGFDNALIHYTTEGNYVGGTQYGAYMLYLPDLRTNIYYSGTALLIPYCFVANAADHTLVGEVQFSGQDGKKLYALLPPTSDGFVDPRENYIINGVSYKACGDILKLFL